MTIAVVILSGLLTLVALDDLRLRRQIQRRKREDAEATVHALGNTVLVDGVQLPKPDDERWTQETLTFTVTRLMNGKPTVSDEKQEVLCLGPVVLQRNSGVHVNLTALPRTTATEKYAQRCWTAFHSRTVRKAIEA